MTTSRRTFNVNQVVSILEDLGTFEEATVYIEPPAVGEDTDEDSGDEDDGGVVSNLNRNQLLAGSVATIVRQGVRSSVEDLAAELPADADHESSPSDTEPIDVNEPSTSSATPASSSRQCRGKRVQQTRTTTGPSKEKKTKIMKPKQQKQEREWQKKAVQIGQPSLIKHYNNTMGGVDRCDQNISKYRTQIRSKKWTWPLVAYCIDLCVQQAWHLYRATPKAADDPMDLLAFRRSIAQAYLARGPRHAHPGRPRGFSPLHHRVPDQIRFDRLDHLVQPWATQLKCIHCGMKTKHRCVKCKVGVHDRCFIQYHTQ
ncbi:uncharacterized protein [Littorina saxatilis]|uniref:uncharacterized protein isoform X2 n=1 Tax=Littorina saxatilis TaxID=31220 RepID=UPI0038B6939A